MYLHMKMLGIGLYVSMEMAGLVNRWYLWRHHDIKCWVHTQSIPISCIRYVCIRNHGNIRYCSSHIEYIGTSCITHAYVTMATSGIVYHT